MKKGKSDYTESIFLQPDLLLTYADDEFSKVERILDTNNDYRSTLLRAAGLNEFLLKARIAALWWSDQCEYDGHLRSTTALSAQSDTLERLAKYSSGKNMCDFLIGEAPFGQSIQLRQSKFFKASNSLAMTHYWNHAQAMDIDELRELRNEAIHTHLSIPAEYAEAAKETASAALKEYKESWLALFNGVEYDKEQWQQPSWREFCTCCQVHFLPTSIR